MSEPTIAFDGDSLRRLLNRLGLDSRKRRLRRIDELTTADLDVPSNKTVENAVRSGTCTERAFAGLARLIAQQGGPADATAFRAAVGVRTTRLGAFELDAIREAAARSDAATLARFAASIDDSIPLDLEQLRARPDLPDVLSLGYYDDVNDGRGRSHLSIARRILRHCPHEETEVWYGRLLRTAVELAYRYADLETLRDALERLDAYGRNALRTRHHGPALDVELQHTIADYGNLFDHSLCGQLRETARDHPDEAARANTVVRSHHCTACTAIRAGSPGEAAEALRQATRAYRAACRRGVLTPQQVQLRHGYIALLEAELESNPSVRVHRAAEAANAFEAAKIAGFDHLMAKGYAYTLLSDAQAARGRRIESLTAAYTALFQFRSCPYTFSCLFAYDVVLARLTDRIAEANRGGFAPLGKRIQAM